MMKSDETATKQLYRKFLENRSTPGETGHVIDLLQNEQSRDWFSEVMDEIELREDAIQTNDTQDAEKIFDGLFKKLADSSRDIEIM